MFVFWVLVLISPLLYGITYIRICHEIYRQEALVYIVLPDIMCHAGNHVFTRYLEKFTRTKVFNFLFNQWTMSSGGWTSFQFLYKQWLYKWLYSSKNCINYRFITFKPKTLGAMSALPGEKSWTSPVAAKAKVLPAN